MSPQQRREAVVRAALPLVAEFGTAVTTAQIARAAGIGEATIFRVFPDKEALLDACVAETLDPTNLLGELRSVPLDQPLATRLTDAADALRAHLDRMGAVLGVLSATGHRRRRPDSGSTAASAVNNAASTNTDTAASVDVSAANGGSAGRDAATAAVHESVAELFEPDRTALRAPVDALTEIFLGLMFGHGRMPGARHTLDTSTVVELFLHGAVGAEGTVGPIGTEGTVGAEGGRQ